MKEAAPGTLVPWLFLVALLNTTPSLPVSGAGIDPVLLDWLSTASPFTEPLLCDEAGETGAEKQPK